MINDKIRPISVNYFIFLPFVFLVQMRTRERLVQLQFEFNPHGAVKVRNWRNVRGASDDAIYCACVRGSF